MFLARGSLSTESAAAFAVESVLGEGRGIGGFLALDPGADCLHDACKLMRWHDADTCLKCGRGGHGARNCDVAQVETEMIINIEKIFCVKDATHVNIIVKVGLSKSEQSDACTTRLEHDAISLQYPVSDTHFYCSLARSLACCLLAAC